MEGPDRTPLFLGDLDDPWVAAIADALPSGTLLVPCPLELPDEIDLSTSPRTLIIHRAHLTARDADRLDRSLSLSANRPKVVVCVGPFARYRDQDQWLPICSALIPEATARETIVRHLAGYVAATSPRLKVAIESTNDALARTLADAIASLGYSVDLVGPGVSKSNAPLLVWDAPSLESHWTVELAHRARSHRVITLIGFADRAQVRLARESGASACLELPSDLDDLAYVIDRLGRQRVDGAHAMPPRLLGSRAGLARPVADTSDSL